MRMAACEVWSVRRWRDMKSSGKRHKANGQPASQPATEARRQRRVFTCRAPGQLPMEMWRRSSVEGGGMSWWRCNIVIVTVTNCCAHDVLISTPK